MFPTVPHNQAENGGGGNRTREPFLPDWPESERFCLECRSDHDLTFVPGEMYGGGYVCRGCLIQIRAAGVYFIRAGDLVKIGYAKDPASRLKALQTGNPAKLELLAVVSGTAGLERELHKRFANDRVRGEWFRFSDEIRAYTAAA